MQEPELETLSVPLNSVEAPKRALSLSGALVNYESFDITPVIGKEFPKANVVEWMKDPKSDELLRDLAITSRSIPI